MVDQIRVGWRYQAKVPELRWRRKRRLPSLENERRIWILEKDSCIPSYPLTQKDFDVQNFVSNQREKQEEARPKMQFKPPQRKWYRQNVSALQMANRCQLSVFNQLNDSQAEEVQTLETTKSQSSSSDLVGSEIIFNREPTSTTSSVNGNDELGHSNSSCAPSSHNDAVQQHYFGENNNGYMNDGNYHQSPYHQNHSSTSSSTSQHSQSSHSYRNHPNPYRNGQAPTSSQHSRHAQMQHPRGSGYSHTPAQPPSSHHLRTQSSSNSSGVTQPTPTTRNVFNPPDDATVIVQGECPPGQYQGHAPAHRRQTLYRQQPPQSPRSGHPGATTHIHHAPQQPQLPHHRTHFIAQQRPQHPQHTVPQQVRSPTTRSGPVAQNDAPPPPAPPSYGSMNQPHQKRYHQQTQQRMMPLQEQQARPLKQGEMFNDVSNIYQNTNRHTSQTPRTDNAKPHQQTSKPNVRATVNKQHTQQMHYPRSTPKTQIDQTQTAPVPTRRAYTAPRGNTTTQFSQQRFNGNTNSTAASASPVVVQNAIQQKWRTHANQNIAPSVTPVSDEWRHRQTATIYHGGAPQSFGRQSVGR